MHKNFAPGVETEKIFDRFVPQHGDERWIDIQESAAQGAAANAESGAQNQGAGARLRTAERFFITLVLDGGRELLRNKFQDFAVALAETDVLVVALYHERSHASRAAFQRNS